MTDRPELHPACAAFPPLPEQDMKDLAADIGKNGLRDAVTLTPDGLLLDGRCRWEACERAGVEPRTEVYDGDPFAFVVSKNKHRRHMNKSQMALALARLDKLPRGGRHLNSDLFAIPLSAAELAKQAGISETYVKFGRALVQNAEPHIVQMVESGAIGARAAAEAVTGIDRNVQATWSLDDIKRKGAAITKERRDSPAKPNRPKGPKSKSAKAPPQKVIDIPYKTIKFPSPEETGFPLEGDMHEKDAHRARYGRTPLHPMDVKHLLEHERDTGVLEAAIINLTGSSQPTAERFFEMIDAMLAWTPQRGATNGRERDFAPKARRRLEVLRERVPKALALLKALERKLIERDAGRSGAAGAHIHEAPPQVS